MEQDNRIGWKDLTVTDGTLQETGERYITDASLKWTGREGSVLEAHRTVINRERKEVVTYEVPETWEAATCGDAAAACGTAASGDAAASGGAAVSGKKESILEHLFGFHCFVYSESPSETSLIFSFGKDGKTALQFEYCLNYAGWKEINIPYERGFMKGKYRADMNQVKICLSGCGQAETTVYLDEICLCRSMDPLHVYERMSDRVKELGKHTKRSIIWEYDRNGTWLNRPVFMGEEPTEAQKEAFARLEERYLSLCDEIDMPPFVEFRLPPREELLAFWDGYALKEEQGRITGVHIQDSTTYVRMMKALARECRKEGDRALQERFRLAFLHLKDQNTVINWYNGRGAASSLLLMKPYLKQMGILEEAVDYIKGAYEFSRIYDVTSKNGVAGYRFEDSDVIGMELPTLLASILLMEDGREKMTDMRHFHFYLENYCLGYAPGIASGCKKDGTIFHHGGYVRSYQTVAVYSLTRVLDVLADTEFQIGEEARKRLWKILLTEYQIYQGVYESFGMSQYFFQAKSEVSVCEFAHFARAFHDRQAAAMYLRLAQTSSRQKASEYYREFTEQGIRPAVLPDSHKTLAYAAAAVHRRGELAATVRGCSQYVYPVEVWPDEVGSGSRYSAFGMYRSFGFLELSRYPDEDSGVKNGVMIDEGFDYRRWNGTTAVCIPYEQLKSRPYDVEDEWAEWLFSDQPFVGGLDDSRQNGIFVLQLHGHPKYGLDSFRANKSWHFYEDVILCLGSGIRSECGYDAETTIFQDYGSGAKRHGNILTDNRNNGYFLWEEDDLRFFEKDNVSRDMKDQNDTFGHRVFALLNHGSTPKDASYRYLIRMGKGEEGIRQLDIAGQIQIIRQDPYAHIVRMFNKTDYVMFRKDYEIHDRYIDGVTESCLMTVTENEDGSINLAVCDPDLRFYFGESEDYDLNRNMVEKAVYGRFWNYQESRPSRIWVVVNGSVSSLEAVKGGARIVQKTETKTILEFVCSDGLTEEVRLAF